MKPRHTAFESILYRAAPQAPAHAPREAPEFFHDLNLDQIVQTVSAAAKDYDLAAFFHAPLDEPDAIAYRQEVFRDLEHADTLGAVRSFCGRLQTTRGLLAATQKLRDRHEANRWFLGAAEAYCGAVADLSAGLAALDLGSRGLRAWRDYIAGYAASPEFDHLAGEAKSVVASLAAIRYSLVIRGDACTVRRHEGEIDYSVVVEETFAKFRSEGAKDYRSRFAAHSGLNHVEAQVLDRVALLHPERFGALEAFRRGHADFVDARIARFDREVQFYVAYLQHVRALRRTGLAFCYPSVSRGTKEISGSGVFDLALAAKLVAENVAVVRNDFHLRGAERIFVVSGPNQGGKTTFARTLGQLHYLARLGCPVPGTQARLYLCDRIFAHFEREEDIATLRGKLEDDLTRIRHILEAAGPDSLVIMNEIFSSTTLKDAIFLSEKVMTRLCDLDALCVWVTFLDELASFGAKTVSVVSAIDPQDPAARTYKIERRPADGLAYALALAEKRRVTYAWLKRRIVA